MKNLTEKNENVAVLENVEKKVGLEKVYSSNEGKIEEVKENEKSIFNIHALQIIEGIKNLREEGSDKFSLIELEQRVLFLFPSFFNRPNGKGLSTQSFKSIFSVWAGKIKKAGYII